MKCWQRQGFLHVTNRVVNHPPICACMVGSWVNYAFFTFMGVICHEAPSWHAWRLKENIKHSLPKSNIQMNTETDVWWNTLIFVTGLICCLKIILGSCETLFCAQHADLCIPLFECSKNSVFITSFICKWELHVHALALH